MNAPRVHINNAFKILMTFKILIGTAAPRFCSDSNIIAKLVFDGFAANTPKRFATIFIKSRGSPHGILGVLCNRGLSDGVPLHHWKQLHSPSLKCDLM